jgi:hypothetical protein
VFVCCCWGGRVVHLRAWSKSSLTLFSLLRLSSLSSLSPLVVICVNGFVVVVDGVNGCRLVCPAWHLFIYLLMGWKRVLFCQSRRQVSSENHVFSPLHVVFSISFHYFLCSLPLPLLLQGWKGCLLTSGVVSIYLLVVDGEQWALKGRLGKVLSAMALPLRSFKHV